MRKTNLIVAIILVNLVVGCAYTIETGPQGTKSSVALVAPRVVPIGYQGVGYYGHPYPYTTGYSYVPIGWVWGGYGGYWGDHFGHHDHHHHDNHHNHHDNHNDHHK